MTTTRTPNSNNTQTELAQQILRLMEEHLRNEHFNKLPFYTRLFRSFPSDIFDPNPEKLNLITRKLLKNVLQSMNLPTRGEGSQNENSSQESTAGDTIVRIYLECQQVIENQNQTISKNTKSFNIGLLENFSPIKPLTTWIRANEQELSKKTQEIRTSRKEEDDNEKERADDLRVIHTAMMNYFEKTNQPFRAKLMNSMRELKIQDADILRTILRAIPFYNSDESTNPLISISEKNEENKTENSADNESPRNNSSENRKANELVSAIIRTCVLHYNPTFDTESAINNTSYEEIINNLKDTRKQNKEGEISKDKKGALKYLFNELYSILNDNNEINKITAIDDKVRGFIENSDSNPFKAFWHTSHLLEKISEQTTLLKLLEKNKQHIEEEHASINKEKNSIFTSKYDPSTEIQKYFKTLIKNNKKEFNSDNITEFLLQKNMEHEEELLREQNKEEKENLPRRFHFDSIDSYEEEKKEEAELKEKKLNQEENTNDIDRELYNTIKKYSNITETAWIRALLGNVNARPDRNFLSSAFSKINGNTPSERLSHKPTPLAIHNFKILCKFAEKYLQDKDKDKFIAKSAEVFYHCSAGNDIIDTTKNPPEALQMLTNLVETNPENQEKTNQAVSLIIAGMSSCKEENNQSARESIGMSRYTLHAHPSPNDRDEEQKDNDHSSPRPSFSSQEAEV